VILGVFLGTLFFGLALGVPVAFALMFCAIVMMSWMGIFNAQIVSQQMVTGANTFTLLAIPFFLLAGELMNAGGLSRRIVEFAVACVGHIRGGLGYRRDHRRRGHGLAVGLGGGGLGGARRDPDPDDARGRLQRAARRRPDGGGRRHRARHPAVDRLHHLRRRRQRVDHRAVHGRHRARPDDGPVADRGLDHRVAARERGPCRAGRGRSGWPPPVAPPGR
jgi:hypothetical protein